MKNFVVSSLAVLAFMASGVASATTIDTSAQQAQQSQAQSLAGGGSVSEDSHAVYEGTRYATGTAIAPALTSSNDTCMGSSSAGAQGMSFGVSIGSTWTDANCKLLKNSRELWNMGNRVAAVSLLCTNEDNRYAISVSGGIPYRKDDGTIIRIACPMTKEEWIAKGRPLIDPVTNLEVQPGSVITLAK